MIAAARARRRSSCGRSRIRWSFVYACTVSTCPLSMPYLSLRSFSTGAMAFVVQEAASYLAEDVPLERVFRADDAARLNLITCDGAWVQGKKEYDRRLVVYAALAP